MAKFVIEGGQPLRGSITVPGNKNAVLPAMAASLLTDENIEILNVPHILDVKTMGLLLSGLGVKVEGTNTRSVRLSAKKSVSKQPNEKLVADLRASVLLLGPMLTRFGKVTLRHPGGDIIGKRSIDQHISALRQLGATVEKSGLVNTLTASNLTGARVYLKEASVTATENLLMAAVKAKGKTEVLNAASEPHVVCLGRMLNKMGAKIEGLGSNRLAITGVKKLTGCRHAVRPDHIEAGTWAILAAATDGEIDIHCVHPEDMVPVWGVIREIGVIGEEINCREHTPNPERLVCIRAKRGKLTGGVKLQTNIWPGFPTDLMSPAIVLATQAEGTTLAHDWMYEARMFFVDRLIKMGANIIIADPHRVIISGPTPLFGRNTSSPDIRAGMALVIAALVARGKSQINMAELVDRGYEMPEQRLVRLGAKISRIS